MTDTSPLVRIKKAFAALRTEVKDLELRIGVVGHSLMQAKVGHDITMIMSSLYFTEKLRKILTLHRRSVMHVLSNAKALLGFD